MAGPEQIRSAEECAQIRATLPEDSDGNELSGCPMGQGGTYIFGQAGDDRVVISGDLKGHKVVAHGGTGDDEFIRTESGDVGAFLRPMTDSSDNAIVAMLAVVALVGFLVWRVIPSREKSE